MATTPAAQQVVGGELMSSEASPLFLSSSGVQNALLTVEADLGLLSRSLVSGTSALRGAYTRPASCVGASDLGACLSALRQRVDKLAPEARRLERVALSAASFGELLGHCQASLESNQRRLDRLVAHLSGFGYEEPEAEEASAEAREWEYFLEQDRAGERAAAAGSDAAPAPAPGAPAPRLPSQGSSGQETPALQAPAVPQPFDEETPKDDSACLGAPGTAGPEERATDELSIPSLSKLGLSSATMAAIGGPHAAEASPFWDRRSDDEDGDGDTRELYRQVISRQTPHPAPAADRRGAREAPGTPTEQMPVTPAPSPAPARPAAAASARRSARRPQSSIRKPLSNVNYSELAMQRSAMKPRAPIAADAASLAIATHAMRPVSWEEFERMPTFLTSRMTLEQLNAAVEGINAALSAKAASGLAVELGSPDLEGLGLGTRCQSVLGCLVRMDRMELGSAGGKTFYRLVAPMEK